MLIEFVDAVIARAVEELANKKDQPINTDANGSKQGTK
tara:strand:- start:460 stop:573 length:114 start_codon:yes stop_codon:yes gene_type:complete